MIYDIFYSVYTLVGKIPISLFTFNALSEEDSDNLIMVT